jgi:hypothetical protein
MTRIPDIFRVDSMAARVLRWMVYQGEVSSADFKAAHVALGGTKHSTHAFDRYFAGFGQYVPFAGGYGIIQREGWPTQGGHRANPSRVRWVGSSGNTFEERAYSWLQQIRIRAAMPSVRLDVAYFVCRSNPDDIVERAWCAMIRRKFVCGTHDSAPVAPRHRLLQKLTNAEIEDWHGYCEAQAVETGGDLEAAWLVAVRQDIARRESEHWARRKAV